MELFWMLVTKFDGTKQPFQREKVIGTCMRMRVSREKAEIIADKIEHRIYDGITTKKILQMTFKYLKEFPASKHQIDLRTAISILRSMPDFERYIQQLLAEQGYILNSCNLIGRGKCVEHELDAIVQFVETTYVVEIKHHRNPHIFTGLDIPRIAQATLDDIKDGFKANLNTINATNALIVTNTKFSDHAIQYASCKGISLIGWKFPLNHGLEQMIENTKFYPITMLQELGHESIIKLLDNEIILMNQLLTHDINILQKKCNIPKKQLKNAIKTVNEVFPDFK